MKFMSFIFKSINEGDNNFLESVKDWFAAAILIILPISVSAESASVDGNVVLANVSLFIGCILGIARLCVIVKNNFLSKTANNKHASQHPESNTKVGPRQPDLPD